MNRVEFTGYLGAAKDRFDTKGLALADKVDGAKREIEGVAFELLSDDVIVVVRIHESMR